MIEPLQTTIEGIPFDLGLGSEPVVLVVPAEEDASTADLFRRFGKSPAGCRAHERTVAIVTTGVLNTPDRVDATGGRRDVASFEVDLEIRRFDGPIRANDPWIALIRMELGSLQPGAYEIVVSKTEFHFTDLRHPERATNPTTSERRIAFNAFEHPDTPMTTRRG